MVIEKDNRASECKREVTRCDQIPNVLINQWLYKIKEIQKALLFHNLFHFLIATKSFITHVYLTSIYNTDFTSEGQQE